MMDNELEIEYLEQLLEDFKCNICGRYHECCICEGDE